MARYTGKNLVVSWVYSRGTVSLNGDFRSFKTNESVDTADKSAGADTHRSFVPTLRDTTASLEFLDTTGSSGTAQWAATEPGTEGTVVWSPQGTASGAPKYSAAAFIESRDRSMPYDDVVSVTVEFHIQAEPTASTW